MRLEKALHIEHPIIQGPFGGGSSSVKLASTVSNLGGLGSFGANHLSPAEIQKLASDLRAETAKPFAINLWVGDHDGEGFSPSSEAYERALRSIAPFVGELEMEAPKRPALFGQKFSEQVAALLEARPPVFSFIFGVPSPEILGECRKRGIATLGTATTVEEAVALDQAGVDVIVATGSDAGGHRTSFLRPAEESLNGTFSLIPKVVDRVRAPVVAAGGIADPRGVRAAFALGASGVQVGSAFLACDESGANPVHRSVLHSPEVVEWTGLTRGFSGRLARGVRNRLMREMETRRFEILPYPAQDWLMGQLKKKAVQNRREDLMSLWAGQAAPLIKHRTAAALMNELLTAIERK